MQKGGAHIPPQCAPRFRQTVFPWFALCSKRRGAAPVLTCVVHFSNAHPPCSPLFFRRRRHTRWKTFLHTMRRFKCDADCEVCWGGPTYFAYLHRMPVEVLRRRFAAPLFVTVVLTQRGGRQGICFSFIPSGFSRPLCRTVCSLGCGPASFTVPSVPMP